MLTINELEVTLRTILDRPLPTKEKDIYWRQGALDIVNLLIKKTKEKEDSTPHYSFN